MVGNPDHPPIPLLFVGLGNPGVRYEKTRHNVGNRVVREMASSLGWSFTEDRHFQAAVARGVFEGRPLHLLLPSTYMNLSGNAVRSYSAYFRIPVEGIVIVVDDVALTFGKLRLRSMGSAGGHNGLKSVEASLGTVHYKRLRVGIGHQGEKVLADYVLEVFNSEEQEGLLQVIEHGVTVLHRLLKEPFLLVMSQIDLDNKPPITGRGE